MGHMQRTYAMLRIMLISAEVGSVTTFLKQDGNDTGPSVSINSLLSFVNFNRPCFLFENTSEGP